MAMACPASPSCVAGAVLQACSHRRRAAPAWKCSRRCNRPTASVQALSNRVVFRLKFPPSDHSVCIGLLFMPAYPTLFLNPAFSNVVLFPLRKYRNENRSAIFLPFPFVFIPNCCCTFSLAQATICVRQSQT
jgi:hypothetical protein